MRQQASSSQLKFNEKIPLDDFLNTQESTSWWRTLLEGCSEIWRTCTSGCRKLLQCLTEQVSSARCIACGLSSCCWDRMGSCRPVVNLAQFFSKAEELAPSRQKGLRRKSNGGSPGAGLARVAAARRGERLLPCRAVRQRRRLAKARMTHQKPQEAKQKAPQLCKVQ